MKKIKQDIIQQDKIKTTKLKQDNAGRRKKNSQNVQETDIDVEKSNIATES